jgi:hypothetical protein
MYAGSPLGPSLYDHAVNYRSKHDSVSFERNVKRNYPGVYND